jgi:hypothetical protein
MPARITVAGGRLTPTRAICQMSAIAASAPRTAAAPTPALPNRVATPEPDRQHRA